MNFNRELNSYLGVHVGTESTRAFVVNNHDENIRLHQITLNCGNLKPDTNHNRSQIFGRLCVHPYASSCTTLLIRPQSSELGLMQLAPLPFLPTDTDEYVTFTGSHFKKGDNDKNVVLWMDHRSAEETRSTL